MADSTGGRGAPGQSDGGQVALPAHPPAEVAPPRLPAEAASQAVPAEFAPQAETEIATPHPRTAVAAPHPPAEVAPHAPAEVALPHPPTEMAVPYPETGAAERGSGVPAQDDRTAGQGVSGGRQADTVRHGPGVPVSAAAGQAGLTAEQVWRAGWLVARLP
jgi:hypothetical protein